MLGYQTQSQGSTAGLSLYGSRDFAYSMPVQHLLHRDPNAVQWPESAISRPRDLPSWPSSLRQYAGSTKMDGRPTRAAMATAMVEPADLSRLVDIEFAAFREEKVNHHLSYRDSTDSGHVNRTLRTYRKYMNKLRSVPEDGQKISRLEALRAVRSESGSSDRSLGFRFRKVESPEGGEIIAFCKSEMAEMTQEEISAPLDIGHEGEPQMNRDWFALNELYHRQYCGERKHCYFGMLATHPDHQHQGAATMLMDELIAEADRLGVEIYCEATRTGRPLYEKYGFVVVKEITFDTAPYGSDVGEEHQAVMVRGALGPDGRRCRVRSWAEATAESALITRI